MLHKSISTLALALTTAALTASAQTQTARRDDIGKLLGPAPAEAQMAQAQTGKPAAPATGAQPPSAAPAVPEKDPREGDPSHEQAQRLMRAIDAVLQDTAKNRGEA